MSYNVPGTSLYSLHALTHSKGFTYINITTVQIQLLNHTYKIMITIIIPTLQMRRVSHGDDKRKTGQGYMSFQK